VHHVQQAGRVVGGEVGGEAGGGVQDGVWAQRLPAVGLLGAAAVQEATEGITFVCEGVGVMGWDDGWMEGGWRVDGGWMEGGWRVDGGQ